MIKTSLIIIFCLAAGVLFSQAPVYAWAGRIGADSSDFCSALTVDVLGNVYTTGSCVGTIDFDPGPGTYTLAAAAGALSPAAQNIYISKMDASGNLLWAKRIGDTITIPNSSDGLSIRVDASGNVYSVGFYKGTVDFDPGPGIFNLSNPNPYGIGNYILKLDANGNFVWAKQLTGIYWGYAAGLELDVTGNLYLTGFFSGTIDIDPGMATFNLTSLSNNIADAFILKLDAGGNFIFARQLKAAVGSVGVNAVKITLDGSGNIYTKGSFWGITDFDPGTGVYNLTSANGSNTFILKLDASGNFAWAKHLDGDAILLTDGALVAGGNFLFLTGTFNGTVDFDPGPGSYSLTAVGASTQILQTNQYVLKLDLAGNFVWAKNLASTIWSFGSAIALDAAASVYVVGSFQGPADFDPGPGVFTLNNNGGADGYIQKLDAAGNFVWAETVAGISADGISAVAIGSNADIYIGGYFQSTADFDPGNGIVNLTSGGKLDIFIAKWSQCSSATAPLDVTPSQNKVICQNNAASLFASAVNPVSWYASPTGTVSMGTGNNYVSPPLALGNYTYYAADPICGGIGRTAISVTVDACTSLRSLNIVETSLNIYPVPSFDGLLSVDISVLEENIELKVYNMLGEQILEQKVLSAATDLDLSAQTKGIYLVKVLKNNMPLAVQKVIIQ